MKNLKKIGLLIAATLTLSLGMAGIATAQEKVLVCHNGNTIEVPSWSAHISEGTNHDGDSLGPCPTPTPTVAPTASSTASNTPSPRVEPTVGTQPTPVFNDGLPKCYPFGISAGDPWAPGETYPPNLKDCPGVTQPNQLTLPPTDSHAEDSVAFAANAIGLYLIVGLILGATGLAVVAVVVASHFRKI